MASAELSVSTFKRKIDAQLTCAVCLDQYNNPKTLPCLHSFCLECILKLPKQGNYISCPTCRVEYPLPEQGADSLPSAFHINSLLELNELGVRKERKPSCPEHHGEAMNIFCETCNKVICQQCAFDTHKQHNMDLISKCYYKHHDQLNNELRNVQNKIADMNTAIGNLTNREDEVEKQRVRLSLEIHQHAQQLIDIIYESERQLIQQVDTIIQHKKEFLAEQKDAAERVHRQLKTCELEIERNLREMSQEKVIMEKQAMIKQMEKAYEHVDPAIYAPIEEANGKFKRNTNFKDGLHTIGEITDDTTCVRKIVEVSTGSPFVVGKKCSLSLTLQSQDGSPFPVHCSAISCVGHTVTGDTEVLKYSVSKNWFADKYAITYIPQNSKICKLEVLVGGAGVANNLFCDIVPPVKTINLNSAHRHVAICEHGEILAIDTDTHSITVLDLESGRMKTSLGVQREAENTATSLTHPDKLTVTNDGHILVTDCHRLQKLTLYGACVKSVGTSESGSGQLQFNHPTGIAVHPTTGQIFVADANNNRVQVLNADLTFSHIITPQDDQQFQLPIDVSLDSEGYLYVAEFDNHCITKLTTTGQYITRFGSKGSAPGQLSCPSSLLVSPHNCRVYVSEWGNHRVSVFDTRGRFLHYFGKRGNGNGQFICPRGLAFDKQSMRLYINDYTNKRIVVY